MSSRQNASISVCIFFNCIVPAKAVRAKREPRITQMNTDKSGNIEEKGEFNGFESSGWRMGRTGLRG